MVSLKYKRDALRRLGCTFLDNAVIAYEDNGKVCAVYQYIDIDTAIEAAYEARILPAVEEYAGKLLEAGWYTCGATIDVARRIYITVWCDRNGYAICAHENTDVGTVLAYTELQERGL